MFRIYFVLVISLFSTPLMAKSIVVLGDSISAAYGIEVQKGWVNLIQKKILSKNSSYQVFNESISGDTSAGGLARIETVLKKYQPELLILELGANDGLRGLSIKQMKSNLTEIIQNSQEAGATVLLLGMRIPPNYGKRYVEMFYHAYPQLAQKFQIPFVPFILEDLALAKNMMQKDGLHPNTEAQPIIANKIWQHLSPILGL